MATLLVMIGKIDTPLSDVTFEFKDPRHATMFLLVWGQYKKG
jgi:hypothetical protein